MDSEIIFCTDRPIEFRHVIYYIIINEDLKQYWLTSPSLPPPIRGSNNDYGRPNRKIIVSIITTIRPYTASPVYIYISAAAVGLEFITETTHFQCKQ